MEFEKNTRDALTGMLVGLARATDGNEHLISDSSTAAVVESLAAPEDGDWAALCARVEAEKRKMVPDCFHCANPCGKNSDFDIKRLEKADADVRELKLRLLGLIRAAAAKLAGGRDERAERFFYKALIVIGLEDYGAEDLLPILREAEELAAKAKA